MGLSGRKVKQRIPKDPRNLSWADDAARFGSNYLSKFGWDSSKGLGAAGDGMTSHIKVSHKLDMLGIGANHQKDPNGIAWKQNRDFENLLKRLNDNLAAEDAEEKVISEDEEPASGRTKERRKKRKHQDVGEDEERHKKKKKKKESEAQNVEESCSNPENPEQTGSITVQAMEIIEEVSVDIKRPVVPRHRAHRARAIAAKNIASKSAAHISEILGVAPDVSTIKTTTTTTSQAKLTSATDTDALGMDKITTSTKTVADYFKDKLLARSKLTDSTSTSPSPFTDTSNEDESHEAPRMGLGAGASNISMDIRRTQTHIEEETQRLGMSKFSSLMSASFLASASSFSSFVPPTQGDVDRDEGSAYIPEVESEHFKERKQNKKSKDKSKKVEEEEVDLESAGVDEKKGKKDKKEKRAKGKETIPEEQGIGETVEENTSKKRNKDRSKRSGEVNSAKEDENESRKKEKGKSKGSGLEKEKRKEKNIR